MEEVSDAQLVAAALRNPDDYAPIVERYEARLLRYIRRISNVTNEEAEEVLQEVFLKAYENLNDFDERLKFSSWIYRIAHNETISNWRRKKARAEEIELADEDAENLFAAAADTPTETDSKILAAEVKKILTDMPPKSREVLVLKFLEGRKIEEISDILRVPAGTVAARISRAKKDFASRAHRSGIEKFIN